MMPSTSLRQQKFDFAQATKIRLRSSNENSSPLRQRNSTPLRQRITSLLEYINTTQKFNITFSQCLSVVEGIEKIFFNNFMRGFMYILECFDGSYYTGSTVNLKLRIQQHQNGEGSNHTRKHRPVELVYYEEFDRIDEAFLREKQIQKWSRKKKEALHKLAECRNESHYLNAAFDSAQAPNDSAQAPNDSAQAPNHSTQRPDIFE